MIIPRPVYSVLLYLAAPFAMLYLTKRAKKQPEYSENWGERFGTANYPKLPAGRTRIWIHAVSVGETRATFTLVEEILRKWPNVDILYTHMTPTGREVGAKFAKKFGSRILQSYLPYDTPRAVKKFIRQTKPSLCLLMETEVWPNLTFYAQKKGIPVVLANARLSEKSLKQGKKVGSLIRKAMERLTLTLAQSEDDATRLKEAGCKEIQVLGNLKFDFSPNAIQVRTGSEIKKLADRKVLTFASSREGEEKRILDAFKSLRAQGKTGNAVLLLIPRHPQRFEEVAALIVKEGFNLEKRSAIRDWRKSLSKEDAPDVILGDSMGEMNFYYALSDVVLMGGSFENFGSQSVIEPCAIGVPVIVGPSIFNFKYIIEKAEKQEAVLRAQTPEDALETALNLLSEEERRVELGQKAADFAFAQRGATQKTMAVIDDLLSSDASNASKELSSMASE